MSFLDDLFTWAATNYAPGDAQTPSIGVQLSSTVTAPSWLGPTTGLDGTGTGSLDYYPRSFLRGPFGGFGMVIPAYFSGSVGYGPQFGSADGNGYLPTSVDVQIRAPQITVLRGAQETYEVVFSTPGDDGSDLLLAILNPPEETETSSADEPAGILDGQGVLLVGAPTLPVLDVSTITVVITPAQK